MASLYVLIDSPDALRALLTDTLNLPQDPPSLYLHAVDKTSGTWLYGIAIFLEPLGKVFFIDIDFLKSSAFTTACDSGATLADVLHSTTIPKVFFDVRELSSRLYTQHGVKMSNVIDVQLMETAARPGHMHHKKYLKRLPECIAELAVKQELYHTTLERAAVQLRALPQLRCIYWNSIPGKIWTNRLLEATDSRLRSTWSPDYDHQNAEKDLSPWQIPPVPNFASEEEMEAWNDDVLEQWNLERNLGHRDTESGAEEFQRNEATLEIVNLEHNLGHRDTESGEDEFRRDEDLLDGFNEDESDTTDYSSGGNDYEDWTGNPSP